MQRTLLGGLAVLTMLVPAPADARTPSARCVFEVRFTLAPGLSVVPSRGEFTSGGETGTITCHGALSSGAVTGPGSFGAQGRYGTNAPGDSCLTGGEGEGVQSFTILTAGGPIHVTNPITFRYGIATGKVLGGTFEGGSFSGTFEIESFEGDCVANPMSVVVLRGKGFLSA